jgi:rhodanese-related sulfurtransferase
MLVDEGTLKTLQDEAHQMKGSEAAAAVDGREEEEEDIGEIERASDDEAEEEEEEEMPRLTPAKRGRKP